MTRKFINFFKKIAREIQTGNPSQNIIEDKNPAQIKLRTGMDWENWVTTEASEKGEGGRFDVTHTHISVIEYL